LQTTTFIRNRQTTCNLIALLLRAEQISLRGQTSVDFERSWSMPFSYYYFFSTFHNESAQRLLS